MRSIVSEILGTHANDGKTLHILYVSVAQPFYTRGTLNIVEESWRHTNPILHIVEGGGEDGL
jgi:hypothetical protein